MFRRHRRLLAGLATLAVAGSVVLVAPPAGAAQALQWTGQAGSLWSAGANWSPASPGGPQTGDSVTFPFALVSLATTATTNDTTTALNTVTFAGSGYTVGGNFINVAGGISQTATGANTISGVSVTVPIANLPIDIASGGTLTSGPLTGSFGLTKSGAGRLVLLGANTYAGTTTVTGGALIVNGNSAASPHTIAAGVLGGNGVVGPVTATAGAISPGDGGAGLLTVNGTLNMSVGSSLAIDILNTTPGTGFDVLRATSTVTLGGAQLIVSGSGSGAVNQQFVILDNQSPSPISGTFAGLAEGATFTAANGQTYRISYIGGTGNDVVLTQLSTAGKAIVLGGPDRIDTAILVSKNSFPTAQSAQAVVLARADLFPDALAGAPLAVAKGGPLELTSLSGPTFIDPRTVTEIQRVLAPGRTIYVLGGPAAIADNVVAQLQSLGYQVIRFGGTDRFQTAVIIAQNGLNNPVNLFLANGINFPDALSAGPAAAKVQGAILLTNNNTMPAFTSNYLATRTGVTVYALGGPAAGAAPTAIPIVGVDRYATAVMTAQRFFTNPTAVGVASGVAFPDGLTGGAHIGRLGGPLLLTDPATLPGNVQSYLTSIKATVTQVFVYGGSSAVATPVVTSINTAIA